MENRAEIALRSLTQQDRRKSEQSLDRLRSSTLDALFTGNVLRQLRANQGLYSAQLTPDLRAIIRVEENIRIVVEDVTSGLRVDPLTV